MAEIYNNILKGQIGRVKADIVIDNYFPVVGQTISIYAATKWGQTTEWQTKDGSGNTVTGAGNLINQKDSKQVTIADIGELQQKVTVRNYLTEKEVIKTIYAMQPQALPYFDLTTSKEIIRTDGVATQIRITPNNYYTGEHSVVVRIYKENETTDPVFTATNSVQSDGYKYVEFSTSITADRGIYDVEVDCIDTLTGKVLSKRINKFITVTPRLCPKPADTSIGYEVVTTYNGFTTYGGKVKFDLRLWRNVLDSGLNYAEAVIPRGEKGNASYDRINISVLPAGTTLCLKDDTKEESGYMRRLLLNGNKDSNITSENGTSNFTPVLPLIITHDKSDVWQWGWCGYGAVNVANNCRNIVLDGMGYCDTGIHLFPFDASVFVDSCFFLVSGTSDWEMFGIDINGAGFAGISAKTDPFAGAPWYWRENGWEFKNLKIHHCTIRNTIGEGVYLGYFNSGSNTSGGMTYSAHLMRDIRLYRCSLIDNGFDSVQINNAVGVDFCYNLLSGCGCRREPNQGSAFSCLMDGRVYNCVIKNNYNVIGVMAPFLSRLEIFNCVLTAARMEPGLIFGGWSSDENPEMVIGGREYDIHNNVVKALNIANISGNLTYTGYTMNDNIFITEKGETVLPGFFTGTGNIFIKADLDYENIDSLLKVADSANYNYQIAHNSQAVTSGRNRKALFDMRGYKNWFAKVSHAGPLMGIYKDTSIADASIIFSSIVLAEGQPFTLSQTIKVDLAYAGDIIKYRLCETADLSEVLWIDLPAEGDITYTLSEGFGNKKVYAQLASATEESTIIYASIVYQSVPLSLDSIALTGGYNKTAAVAFNFSGSFTPTKYRLGETADLSGVEWQSYTDNIIYAFATAGDKTLYGQLQDADGNISEVKGASITVVDAGRKVVLSVGWGDRAPNIAFDSELKLNKVRYGGVATAETWKWQDGTDGGTIKNNNNMGGLITGSGWNITPGATTGNNSGSYPDEVLRTSIQTQAGYTSAFAFCEALITIPPGTYKLRLYSSITNVRDDTSRNVQFQTVAGNLERDFVKPENYNILNNISQWLEDEITITESSFLLRWGIVKSAQGTYKCPMNIVEIEEM